MTESMAAGTALHPKLARLLEDVRTAGAAGAWHAALALSLALPDICAKAAGSGLRYGDWFDRYVAPRFRVPYSELLTDDPGDLFAITGHDAFALRNAVLHSGDDDLSTYRHAGDAFLERIILTKSQSITGSGVRKLRVPVRDRKAQFALPIGDFCAQILEGVETWAIEHGADRNVQSCLDLIMTIQPTDVSPDS